MDFSILYTVGITFVVVGAIIIVAAIILYSIGEIKRGKVQGAGVIMVGPVPFIFGTDKKSVESILFLTMFLMIVVLIIMLIYN